MLNFEMMLSVWDVPHCPSVPERPEWRFELLRLAQLIRQPG